MKSISLRKQELSNKSKSINDLFKSKNNIILDYVQLAKLKGGEGQEGSDIELN